MPQTTEATINQAHKDRWAAAAAAHGGNTHLPHDVATRLQEQHRLEWCAFLGRDNHGRNGGTSGESPEGKQGRPERQVAPAQRADDGTVSPTLPTPEPTMRDVVSSALNDIVQSEES